MNDPTSPPTFDTEYAQAWIDLTIVPPSLSAFAMEWKVVDTTTLCDHKYILFRVRSRDLTPRRWLTRTGQARVLASLGRRRWFGQVSNCEIQDPSTLDLILDHFYDVFRQLRAANMQNVRFTTNSKIWWTDDIARERSFVRGLRRWFQRTRDPSERLVRRDIYYSALRKFGARIARAKEVALRNFSNEQSKKCLFGDIFKLAFNKLRSPVCLPRHPNCVSSALCPYSSGCTDRTGFVFNGFCRSCARAGGGSSALP